jgi:hypothetical protein
VLVSPSSTEGQPLNFGDWTQIVAKPQNNALAVVTNAGLALLDPASGKTRTTLVSDVGHSRGRFDHVFALRFYGSILELALSALDQHIVQQRVNLQDKQLRVSTEVRDVSRCEGQEPTLLRDLKYATSRARDRSATLCESTTGRVVARLPGNGTKNVFTTGGNDQAFAVDSLSDSKLWFPQHNKQLPLQGSDALHWHFGASRLLAGETSATRVNVYEVNTARRIATWPIDDHYSHLLAIEEENDWALVGGPSVLQVRRLANGAPLGHVAFGEPVAASFGPAGLVAISDGQKIWFFRAPKLDLLGELLIDGDRGLFVDALGAFETTSVDVWKQELGCRQGQRELAFDRCRKQLHRAGLTRETLLEH